MEDAPVQPVLSYQLAPVVEERRGEGELGRKGINLEQRGIFQ
jgi:hypothetical protein